MQLDPICGMEVDPADPPGGKSEYRGTTYYFCNAGCKRTFDKDPAKHAVVTQ
jgi:Cu+-exporting ATPase